MQNYLLQLNTYATSFVVGGHLWTGGMTWLPGFSTWENFKYNPSGLMLVTYNVYAVAPGAVVYDFLPTPEALALATVGLTLYVLYKVGAFVRLAAAAYGLRSELQPALATMLAALGVA